MDAKITPFGCSKYGCTQSRLRACRCRRRRPSVRSKVIHSRERAPYVYYSTGVFNAHTNTYCPHAPAEHCAPLSPARYAHCLYAAASYKIYCALLRCTFYYYYYYIVCVSGCRRDLYSICAHRCRCRRCRSMLRRHKKTTRTHKHMHTRTQMLCNMQNQVHFHVRSSLS